MKHESHTNCAESFNGQGRSPSEKILEAYEEWVKTCSFNEIINEARQREESWQLYVKECAEHNPHIDPLMNDPMVQLSLDFSSYLKEKHPNLGDGDDSSRRISDCMWLFYNIGYCEARRWWQRSVEKRESRYGDRLAKFRVKLENDERLTLHDKVFLLEVLSYDAKEASREIL